MKNNNFFRQELLVNYLYMLVLQGKREEFNSFFQEAEGYLQRTVNTTDKEYLEKVRAIIDFKKKENVMEM